MTNGLAEVFEKLYPAPVTRRSLKPAAPTDAALAVVADPPKVFRLLDVNDLRTRPRLQWMIHGVLPRSGAGAIFGASGTGKSFLCLDMVAHLAEGGHWFGHKIKGVYRVVLVVLEGEEGFRLRVESWEQANGRPFPANVRFVFQSFELAQLEDVLRLGQAIDLAGGADLIVIDTLNRAAPGADENTARDMGLILEGVKSLQMITLSFVLLVHHAGEDATKGLRGHSSLFAALDVVLEVVRTDERREWSIPKLKDGEDGQVHAFRLEVVDLEDDEDGEPVTSCVVRADDTPTSRRPKLPKTGSQRIVYDALGPLFRDAGSFGKAGAPSIRPCLDLDAAITEVRERLTVEPKRRTERAREAITGLVARGVLACNEGWIWLV